MCSVPSGAPRSQFCTWTEWLSESIAAWIVGEVYAVVRAGVVSPGKVALRLHAEVVVPLVQLAGWYTSM